MEIGNRRGALLISLSETDSPTAKSPMTLADAATTWDEFTMPKDPESMELPTYIESE
jgi:hypothetical protein